MAGRRTCVGVCGLTLVLLAACGGAETDVAPKASFPPPAPPARAAPPPAPVAEKPPIDEDSITRVYRFHVYSTMKSRWKQNVMVEGLVSTSQGGVIEGDKGLLQRKVDLATGEDQWPDVAKIVVRKLLPNGRLQVEIEAEEPESKVKRNGKLPFAPGEKVRLQIDRVMNG